MAGCDRPFSPAQLSRNKWPTVAQVTGISYLSKSANRAGMFLAGLPSFSKCHFHGCGLDRSYLQAQASSKSAEITRPSPTWLFKTHLIALGMRGDPGQQADCISKLIDMRLCAEVSQVIQALKHPASSGYYEIVPFSKPPTPARFPLAAGWLPRENGFSLHNLGAGLDQKP